MIFTALTILFLLLVFTGVGLLFPWNVFREDRRFESLLLCFWIGWSMAIAFLQGWHFFFPVGLGAFMVLLLASVSGWWRARAILAETARGWNRQQALLLAGLALIPCGMLANHVLFSSPNSDYALYHLQTVKWFSNYAIVPGLGNVFNPLATGSANFLYTAMLDSGLLEGRAYYVANTLPTYVAILHSAVGLYALTQGPIRSTDLFNALMLPVILLQASTAYVVAYSPDPVMFFLQIVIAGEVLHLFADPHDARRFQSRSLQLVLLAMAGICLKLSLAVFGALCLLVMVVIGIARYQGWPWRNPRLWLGWAGLACALLIPWLGRSVVMSGYLAFPNTAIGFPLAWKIPPLMADAAQVVVKLWAVTVNGSIEYTADLVWFAQWWNVFPFIVRQTFVFSLGLIVLDLILLAAWRSKQAHLDLGAVALALIIVPSLVFWFIMGPSYRFSGALFWILLAAALLFGFKLLAATRLVTRPELLAYGLVLALSLWLSPNHFSNNLSRRLIFLPPTEQTLAEAALPRASMRQRTTASGLVVNLPPVEVEECWDAPLPCTTGENFFPGLHLLEPGNLQKGFALQLDD